MRPLTFSLLILLVSIKCVQADETKDVQTEKGKAVAIINFVSPKPDCSVNPGPRLLPVLTQRPASGSIAMQILFTDVPPTSNCPERKVPSLALFYAPKPDFVGSDVFQLEVEALDKTMTVTYKITVRDAEMKK